MSIYQPERLDGRGINLAPRVASSTTVVASPAAAAETIIASLTLPANVQAFQSVEIEGYAALTVGTSGVSVALRLRQTNVTGTVIASSGALTATAASLIAPSVQGSDPTASAVATYVLTATVASGAASSTVSAVYLRAIIA